MMLVMDGILLIIDRLENINTHPELMGRACLASDLTRASDQAKRFTAGNCFVMHKIKQLKKYTQLLIVWFQTSYSDINAELCSKKFSSQSHGSRFSPTVQHFGQTSLFVRRQPKSCECFWYLEIERNSSCIVCVCSCAYMCVCVRVHFVCVYVCSHQCLTTSVDVFTSLKFSCSIKREW